MKTKSVPVVPTLFGLLKAKLPGNLVLLGLGILSWMFTGNALLFALVFLFLSSVLLYRFFKGEQVVARDIDTWNKQELIDGLRLAQVDLGQAKLEILQLKKALADRDGVDQDDELKDKVLKLVASTLTAYDTAQGKVSASDTIEALRKMLIMLGREYQADQTRNFTQKDWAEMHESMSR